MSNNQTVLGRVLSSTYFIDGVPRLEAGERLELRDLPWSTFLNLLIDVFEETRKESDEIRARLYAAIKEITDQGETITISNKDLEAFFGFAMPLIFRAVSRLPHAVEMILRDVIVGAEEIDVTKLPLETSLHVVSSVLSRADLSLVAREITKVFSKAMTVAQALPSSKGKSEA